MFRKSLIKQHNYQGIETNLEIFCNKMESMSKSRGNFWKNPRTSSETNVVVTFRAIPVEISRNFFEDILGKNK